MGDSRPLRTYYSAIESLPPRLFNDVQFVDALRKARSGDDEARRRISEGFLKLALSTAFELRVRRPERDTMHLVQEANAALWEAILAFEGASLRDFAFYAQARIRDRLLSFD
jgi:DNA-directed RNA polymerase specialized sigma subunit